MKVLISTVGGSFSVDLETEDVDPWDGEVEPPAAPALNLPRVVAAASAGATVVPSGRAVAISDEDPDLIVYASRNRLFLSRNGGVFWSSLPVELPEIDAVAFPGS